jgi:hypothetical protein
MTSTLRGVKGGVRGGRIFARDEAGTRRLVRGGEGEAEEQHVRRRGSKIRWSSTSGGGRWAPTLAMKIYTWCEA